MFIVGFRINTNVDALSAYNALAKVNKEALTSQLRIASGKRINSVADDTTGFMVGKSLEAKNEVQKSQLNNASAAKNYLATAESSLSQINDLLIKIAGKSADAQDPTKDKSAIAGDIRAIAGEIDSIMKNTSFNGHNLLAQSDGSALAISDTFGIGGNDFTADFASDSYLKAGDLKTALHGTASTLPGFYVGQDKTYRVGGVDVTGYTGPDTTSSVEISLKDGSSKSFSMNLTHNETLYNIAIAFSTAASDATISVGIPDMAASTGNLSILSGDPGTMTPDPDKAVMGVTTTSGFDVVSLLGLNEEASSGGGLMADDTDSVLTAAQNISTVTDNVRASLGRIGNLTQTVDMRSTYLTNSISSNSASISYLFDADMASEQINATKNGILGQAATSMLSQLNSAPQAVLSLFR